VSITIGLNGFPDVGHDAAEALMIDDRIVAAVEEERLTRAKHAHGSPRFRRSRRCSTSPGSPPQRSIWSPTRGFPALWACTTPR
jgi:predicted NodU family carbamoyl transferase